MKFLSSPFPLNHSHSPSSFPRVLRVSGKCRSLFGDLVSRRSLHIVPLIEALLYVACFGVSPLLCFLANLPTRNILASDQHDHAVFQSPDRSYSPQQPAAWAIYTTSLTIGHKVDEFPSQMLTRELVALDSGTPAMGKDDQRSPL